MAADFSFEECLAAGLNTLGLQLDGGAIELLSTYFQELRKWSAKINLIARGTGDEHIVETHFVDSLTLLPLLQEPDSHLLDVGTGAGFPGLVIKAALPQLKLTLVEPRKKRVSFLNHMIRTLHCDEVRVVPCRIENAIMLPSDLPFSHITSRAVSDVELFLAMAARFVRPGQQVICMKGPRWQEELNAARTSIDKLPFVQDRVIHHRLPFSGAQRALLIFRAQEGV